MSSPTTTPPEQLSALRTSFLESLAASGGRLAGDGERRWIEDFGATHEEHAALVEAVGLLELTDRALLRVEGPRATGMLNGLLTNDIARAGDESRAVYSFLLTAKGRPVADLRAIPLAADRSAGGEEGGEAFWLDVPGDAADDVEEHFDRYLPPRFAEHRREGGVFPLGIVGPEAGEILSGVSGGPDLEDLAPLQTAWIEVAGSRVLAVRREPVEGPGFDLYVEGDALRAAWDALAPAVGARGGRPAGRRAWEILRVERGVPAFGSEITREVLPQETGQEDRAISFQKGCYTGQEVVVRIQHRGHVNRHLRGLAFDPSSGPPPAVGSQLRRDERGVGRVTTAVSSPRHGPIGLGYVRREVEPGEPVDVAPEEEEGRDGSGGGPGARVVELPFSDV